METKPLRYIEDRITDLENQFRDLKSGAEIQATEEQRHHKEIQHVLEVKFQSLVAILETKASQEELSSLVDIVAGKASSDHVGRVDAALGEHRAEAERHRTELQGKLAETAGHHQARHAEALSLFGSHRGELESRICSTAAEQSRELESRLGSHCARLDAERNDLDARMGEHGAKLEAHRSELHGRICEAAAEQHRLADILTELLASRQELYATMATKASIDRLQAISAELASKASSQEFQDLHASVERKVSNVAFQEMSAMMSRLATSEQFRELAVMTGEQFEELAGAMERRATAEDLDGLAQDLNDKASRHDLEVLVASIESKASSEEVQGLIVSVNRRATKDELRAWESQLSIDMHGLASAKDLGQLMADLDLKADKTFVSAALDLKADKAFVCAGLDPKADRTWVDERLAKVGELRQVRSRSRTLLFRDDDKDDWHRDL